MANLLLILLLVVGCNKEVSGVFDNNHIHSGVCVKYTYALGLNNEDCFPYYICYSNHTQSECIESSGDTFTCGDNTNTDTSWWILDTTCSEWCSSVENNEILDCYIWED